MTERSDVGLADVGLDDACLDRLRSADRAAPPITISGLSAESLAARARRQLVDRSVQLACTLATVLLVGLLLRQIGDGSDQRAVASDEASGVSVAELLREVQSGIEAWTSESRALAAESPPVDEVDRNDGSAAATVERALAASFFVAHRRAFEGDARALDQVRHIARAFPGTRTGRRASCYLASLDH